MKFRHKRTTTDKKQWPWSSNLNVKTGPVVVKNTRLLPVATVLQRECQSSWIAQHGTSVKMRCSCGVTSREEQYISAGLREQFSVLSVDPSILFIQRIKVVQIQQEESICYSQNCSGADACCLYLFRMSVKSYLHIPSKWITVIKVWVILAINAVKMLRNMF